MVIKSIQRLDHSMYRINFKYLIENARDNISFAMSFSLLMTRFVEALIRTYFENLYN